MKNDLPSLSDMDISFRIQSLISQLQDNHTTVNLPSVVSTYDNTVSEFEDMLFFPIEVKFFEDELVVVKSDETNENLIGLKLVSINNINIDTVLKKLHSILIYDNTQSFKTYATVMICSYDILTYLDIIDSEDTEFTFLTEDDKELSVNLKHRSINSIKYTDISSKIKKFPVTSEKPVNSDDAYWVKYIPEDEVLYFQFNKCIAAEYDYIDSYEGDTPLFNPLVDELIEKINDNDFDKFIIDLRGNSGGNHNMIKVLITRLESNTSISEKANTYVLTDKYTNSAAVLATVDIVNNLDATVVGEETGGNVNLFSLTSSSKPIYLPNSKISIMISASYIDKIPNYKGGYKPHFEVEQSYTDYINGIDSCYEFVKKHS